MSQKYGMLQEGGYNANAAHQPQQPPYQGQPPPAYQSNQPAPAPMPAYGQATPQQSSTVIPATNTTILVQQSAPVPWKWSTTIVASIALWFCCAPMAFCGLLYAIHSYVDHKTQDYTGSSGKLRMAWICAISSIALGVLFWIIIIILYAIALDQSRG